MTLRTFIFWPHLFAGVIAGAVILVMSVTGVLLTYERQLIAWSDSDLRSPPSDPDAARLPLDLLLDTLRQAHPGVTISAVTIGAAADAPVVVSIPQRTLYADAYSGRVLGQGSQGVRRTMSSLRAWHRWLAVEGDGRPFARAITGWSNVVFLFIVASGLYLWLPRRWTWQHARAVLLFRGHLRGKARDFNWHHVIGVWSAVPLFIVVLTAAPISFPWANALVYRVVGETPPAGRGAGTGPQGGRPSESTGNRPTRTLNAESRTASAGATPERRTGLPLNSLLARAEAQVPGWTTINVRLPTSDRAPVVFAIDRGDGGQPHLRSTLTLNRASGAVMSYEAFGDQSRGRRLRSLARFAHTGEVFGLPGQTIVGVVTAGAVFLVWTGMALTLRRVRAWIGRGAERPSAAASSSRENPAA